MWRDKNLRACGRVRGAQAQRGLEFATQGQHSGHASLCSCVVRGNTITTMRRPVHRQRRISAPPAQPAGAAIRANAQHRIIVAGCDGPVMQQQGIGQRGQILPGVGRVDHQRLTCGVATGHHQPGGLRLLQPVGVNGSARSLVEQEMMQRRVGQHHPQGLQMRCQVRPKLRGLWLGVQQHDGALRRRQPACFIGRNFNLVVQRCQIRNHHCQRLGGPPFEGAQTRHRSGLARIAAQVKTTHPLQGHDATAGQQRPGLRNGIARHRCAITAVQRQAWTTIRAGLGLIVKTPVARVLHLGFTAGAQREIGQSGVGPIKRQAARDGVAWPALRAVNEGMTPAPVGGVKQLRQTGITHRQVCTQQGLQRTLIPQSRAGQNGKIGRWHRGQIRHIGIHGQHLVHATWVGQPCQACRQLVHIVHRPVSQHLNAFARVAHPALHVQRPGLLANPGAASHALDQTTQDQAAAHCVSIQCIQPSKPSPVMLES